MTPEEQAAADAQVATDKAAADKAALDAADPAALLKQIAILNSENAARRIKEKEMADTLEKFNADKKAAEDKALAEKGEFKGLYETLKAESDSKDGKITKYEGALNKLLEAEKANIPEQMQALIPAGDISTQLAWIATAKAAKLFETPGGPGVREPGENGKNSISRQAFDSLSPAAKQAHLALAGSSTHD